MVTRVSNILVVTWNENKFIDEILDFLSFDTVDTEEEKIEKRILLQIISALQNEEQEKKLFDGFVKYLENGTLCIIANRDVNSERPFGNIYKFQYG